MNDRNWNDKLRKQLSEYGQTPPEGLWEAVEAKVRKPSAAFPWWWALAGAAAAVAAVLLVVRPEGVTTPSASVKDTAEAVAALERADTLVSPQAEPELDMMTAPAVRKAYAALTPVPTSPAAVVPSAVAGVVPPAEEDSPVAAETESVVPSAGAGVVTPTVEDSPVAAESESEVQQPVEAEVPAAEENASEDKPSGKPVAGSPAPGKDLPVEIKTYPAEKPLYADAGQDNRIRMSFIASGVPGGQFSHSEIQYGIGKQMRMAPSPKSFSSLLSRNRSTETQTEYSLAYRAGILVNLQLSKQWSVESGLQLSRLAGTVTSSVGSISTQTKNTMLYLGIPVYAVYTPWEGRNLGIYFSAGPMAEYGVLMTGSVRETIGTVVNTTHDAVFPKDFIFSLGANAGLQLKIGSLAALFVQPGISWHIPSENSPESYYTAHPLAFTLGGGLRVLF